MTTSVASTPGKLILAGEHAAVYGYPALTTTIGLRVRAVFEKSVERSGEEAISLELPDVEVAQRLDVETIRRDAAEARRVWERTGKAASPRGDGREDPSWLVRVACGEALDALVRLGESKLPQGRLTLRSEIPVGAGFGSSAAMAVAVVGALFAASGRKVTREAVEPIAHDVERRQHGAPSGIDHNTVLRGGTLLARSDDEGRRSYAPVAVAQRALAGLRIFDTGTPSETTGRVVSAVSTRRSDDPKRVERLFHEMGRLVEASIGTLAKGGAELLSIFRDYERCLEDLGVVPAVVQRAIRAVEARGGAAKISGAGCHAGDSAGCLLVTSPVPLPPELERYREVNATLGVPGLEVSSA